jgi:hypothetical protein
MLQIPVRMILISGIAGHGHDGKCDEEQFQVVTFYHYHRNSEETGTVELANDVALC